MKVMKIIIITLLAGLLTLPFLSLAQDNNSPNLNSSSTYKTAIGLRAGGTSGLTIKHFTGSSTAIEGIIGVWPNAFGLTVLVEKYVPAFNEAGLNWYYGAGAHATFETDRHYHEGPRRYYYYHGNDLGLGIDGILGIEYKIVPIPFAISLDLKPFIEVNTKGSVYVALDPGLGIKVAF
jgi:hypothetical protein